MLGIEFDRDASAVQAGARAAGVIVRAAGNNVVMSPPLVITDDQLRRLSQVLIEQVMAFG
jgi:putrescine aminotransferase